MASQSNPESSSVCVFMKNFHMFHRWSTLKYQKIWIREKNTVRNSRNYVFPSINCLGGQQLNEILLHHSQKSTDPWFSLIIFPTSKDKKILSIFICFWYWEQLNRAFSYQKTQKWKIYVRTDNILSQLRIMNLKTKKFSAKISHSC